MKSLDQDKAEERAQARACREAIFAAMHEIDDEEQAHEITFGWHEGALHCFLTESVGVTIYSVESSALEGLPLEEHRKKVHKVWVTSELVPTLARSIQCWREIQREGA